MPKVLDATLCMSGKGNHIPTQPDDTKRSGIRYTEHRPRTAKTRTRLRAATSNRHFGWHPLIGSITYYRTIRLSISNFAVCRKICCGHWRGRCLLFSAACNGLCLRRAGYFFNIRRNSDRPGRALLLPSGHSEVSMRDDHRLKRMTK
jgi:hypothetical protein